MPPPRRTALAALLLAAAVAGAAASVDFGEFKKHRRALLTTTSPPEANALAGRLARAGRCRMAEFLLHSVGHCAFVDEKDDQQLRLMDRWLKRCDIRPEDPESKARWDRWYFQQALHAADSLGEEIDASLFRRMEQLATEIGVLADTVGEERELAYGKRGYVDVIDQEKGAVDINKLIKAHEELGAKLKDGERPLGALNFLAFLSHHENPFLLSRDEQWKLLNAQACARCTFTRATLRREEAGWELLALLSTKSYGNVLSRACPPLYFLVDPPGYDVKPADFGDSSFDLLSPYPVVASALSKINFLHDVQGDARDSSCEDAAAAFVVSSVTMSNTRAGAALFRDLFEPVLALQRLKHYPVPYKFPEARFRLTDFIRGNMRMVTAVLEVAAANAADLARALDPQLEGKFKGEDVIESVVYMLLFSKDLVPVKATVRLLSASIGKLLSTELAKFDRVGPVLASHREFIQLMMEADQTPFKVASRARAAQGRFLRAVFETDLVQADQKMVAQIAATKRWTVDATRAVFSKIPGGARAFEFIRGVGVRLAPRLAVASVLGAAVSAQSDLASMLRNSVALHELAAWVRATFRMPAAFRVPAGEFTARWARGLSRFQGGRLAASAQMVARTASRAASLTRVVGHGASLALRAAGAGALKLAGPLSLALDAYDAGVYFGNGHYAAGALKVGAFALGAVAMAAVVVLPVIGFVALGLSIVVSALAKHMVHVKEKNAQYDFARVLGFHPGADRESALQFAESAACADFTHERKETLQSVVGGLIDGVTGDRYELATARVFGCLADQGQCGMARSLVTHSSGQLSGKSLMSHMHGAEDIKMARVLSRCGVNPGFDAWASYARAYLGVRKCADLAKDPHDYHQKLMKRLLEWYSADAHERALYDMLDCLRQQGKCASVRKLVHEYGFSSLVWRVGGDEVDEKMKALLAGCGFMAFDDDDWARKEIARVYTAGRKRELGTLGYKVQATLFRALFDGATLDDDEEAVLRLLESIEVAHGPHSARLHSILNAKSLGSNYEMFKSNLHGEQWTRAQKYLVAPTVKCHVHGGKYVVNLGSRGCKNTNLITTCDSDGACKRDAGLCPHRCACGDDYFNECLCVRPVSWGTEVCDFEGDL